MERACEDGLNGKRIDDCACGFRRDCFDGICHCVDVNDRDFLCAVRIGRGLAALSKSFTLVATEAAAAAASPGDWSSINLQRASKDFLSSDRPCDLNELTAIFLLISRQQN